MASDRPALTPERLEKAARSLTAMEREALFLSARERLSNQEVAERLDITSEATERLLAKALRKLDRALERQERPWWRFW
ncbi:MAG TPA: sigma factor-like helix-turn-helix DNA-binding protein [Allosphingosinicella sp.]|jgi:RNA polymerase sigma factor (sigma-70 family)